MLYSVLCRECGCVTVVDTATLDTIIGQYDECGNQASEIVVRCKSCNGSFNNCGVMESD